MAKTKYARRIVTYIKGETLKALDNDIIQQQMKASEIVRDILTYHYKKKVEELKNKSREFRANNDRRN